MRALLFSFLFSIAFSLLASDEFVIFEKNGLYGLKDSNGKIAVPPIYEKLGWSDASQGIMHNTIGFKKGNLWGLISTNNKILQEAKYYSLQQFDEQLLKASIKGKFSNHLFHGILNSKGNTVVDFLYFSIEKLKSGFLVSKYDSTIKYGVLDYSEKPIVPINYRSIEEKSKLFIATDFNLELDLYDHFGGVIDSSLDSLTNLSEGHVAFKDGYAAYISDKGTIVGDFLNKEVDIAAGSVVFTPFPKWSVYDGEELMLQTHADSIKLLEAGIYQAFVNGSQQLLLSDTVLRLAGSLLKDVTQNAFVLKNNKTAKWSVISRQDQEEIVSGYDSIFSTQMGFWVKQKKYWTFLDQYGQKKNPFRYHKVKKGINDQFIVLLENYWGILDGLGNKVTTCKYDQIAPLHDYYKVNYLSKYGLMATSGSWKIGAEYIDVYVFDDMLVGKTVHGYSYVRNDRIVSTRAMKPLSISEGALIVSQDSLLGIMDLKGHIRVYPNYEKIIDRGAYFELKRGNNVKVVHSKGYEVYGSELLLQEAIGCSEDLFLIKKNNKWGFLDLKGRLRISNRYDSAKLYSEGLSAVLINGRWGFIDKEENLAIQPYYDQASSFSNGCSVVKIGSKFGIIDTEGSELVNIIWKNISKLPTGGYSLEDFEGKFGLISAKGKILLRPSYNTLQDYGDKVIVSNHGRVGVIDYSGRQLFKTDFKEISISGSYIFLKE